jgi:hypothetical protein
MCLKKNADPFAAKADARWLVVVDDCNFAGAQLHDGNIDGLRPFYRSVFGEIFNVK